MQPAGIASIAARVETGELHDSGVARSSRRHEAQCEGAADGARQARRQRQCAAQPDVAQSLFQQHGGQRGGGHAAQRERLRRVE
jgi:hypothetical protein